MEQRTENIAKRLEMSSIQPFIQRRGEAAHLFSGSCQRGSHLFEYLRENIILGHRLVYGSQHISHRCGCVQKHRAKPRKILKHSKHHGSRSLHQLHKHAKHREYPPENGAHLVSLLFRKDKIRSELAYSDGNVHQRADSGRRENIMKRLFNRLDDGSDPVPDIPESFYQPCSTAESFPPLQKLVAHLSACRESVIHRIRKIGPEYGGLFLVAEYQFKGCHPPGAYCVLYRVHRVAP